MTPRHWPPPGAQRCAKAAILLGLASASGGCTPPKERSHAAGDAGTAIGAPADRALREAGTSPDAPESGRRLDDGVMDYRGTIGAEPVVLRLSKHGATLEGGYSYERTGGPIALAGTAAPDGTVQLDEQVNAVLTGRFTLAVPAQEASELDGRWTSPDGTRPLAVTLRAIVRPVTSKRAAIIAYRRHQRLAPTETRPASAGARPPPRTCDVDVEYPQLLGLADANVEATLNQALGENAGLGRPLAWGFGCVAGSATHHRYRVLLNEAGLFSYCADLDLEWNARDDAGHTPRRPPEVHTCATYDLATGESPSFGTAVRTSERSRLHALIAEVVGTTRGPREAKVFADTVDADTQELLASRCGILVVMGPAGDRAAFAGGGDDHLYELSYPRVRGVLRDDTPLGRFAEGRPVCHDPDTLGPARTAHGL